MVKYISAVLRFHGILSCCIHQTVFNIGLFLTTYAVIGIHRVIFVMEIWTSSIDECNFRICTAVSVFWLNSMRYCGFCTFFCAVLRLSDPLYAPLLLSSLSPNTQVGGSTNEPNGATNFSAENTRRTVGSLILTTQHSLSFALILSIFMLQITASPPLVRARHSRSTPRSPHALPPVTHWREECRLAGQVIVVFQALALVSNPVYLQPTCLRSLFQSTLMAEHNVESGIQQGENSHWCLCASFTSQLRHLSRFSLRSFLER